MKDKNQYLKGMLKSSIALAKDGQLNADDWQVAGVPLGDGKFWMYQDRNAKVKLSDSAIDVEIPQFSNSHDQVQIFDNPKQLYLTKSSFEPGPKGLVGFSCNMKASVFNGDLNDIKDGFCAFNVLDFASAMVFDIVSNGSKIWVVYERLLVPGVTTEKMAFTDVIPIERAVNPEEMLECAVVYNRQSASAEYHLNGDLIYRAENIPAVIDRLQTGFGMITLHPIQNGKSVSCKGQGARGNWSDFARYEG